VLYVGLKTLTPRNHTRITLALAIILTVAGFQQIWSYKWVPPEKIALWFPILLIIRLPDEIIFRLFLCLIQFPLFATAYCFGIRRFRSIPTLCVVLLSYILCVLAGFTLI
jgi:hypothetical protein